MKKTTIVSIVLALMLAADAAAAATTKRPEGRRRRLGAARNRHHRKRDDDCPIVTCVPEGGSCSNDDDTLFCNDYMSCTNGKCSKYTDGSECRNGYCYDINSTFYCDDNDNKCHTKKDYGESCSGLYDECKDTYECFENSENQKACYPYPTKVGDVCPDSYDYCPDGTKCTNHVCKNYPSTVGADCEEEPGCNNNSLYCSSEKKCTEYPGKGEACYNSMCASGHYCDDDNTCKALPVENEECHNYECAPGYYCDVDKTCKALPGSGDACYYGLCGVGLSCLNDVCRLYPGAEGDLCNYDNWCGSGLWCNSSNVCAQYPGKGEECTIFCQSGLKCFEVDSEQKRMCMGPKSKEGEPCSDDLLCEDGLFCNLKEGKCVVGECNYDEDCPSGKGCMYTKCYDFMSLEDGEECGGMEDEFEFNFLLCKEGSSCLKNESSSTGYSCMKVTTKLSNEKECVEDEDCPFDSLCECNSINGKMQCIPRPVSNKTVVDYYKQLLKYEYDSYEYNIYLNEIYRIIFPEDEGSRCATPVPLPLGDDSSSSNSIKFNPIASLSSSERIIIRSDSGSIASNVKPSFALSAVLFVFGLIAAML